MKNISRLVIATILVGVLVIVAGGVWAAPSFAGTVPKPPREGSTGTSDGTGASTQNCKYGKAIDMGTALFVPAGGIDCTLVVKLVVNPAKEYVAAPDGLAFLGDTFKADATPDDLSFKVCYAYPTELADKDAKIYKLNDLATPLVWVEIPGAIIDGGMICVNSMEGVFSLIGNP